MNGITFYQLCIVIRLCGQFPALLPALFGYQDDSCYCGANSGSCDQHRFHTLVSGTCAIHVPFVPPGPKHQKKALPEQG
jgi:hypothetical protein